MAIEKMTNINRLKEIIPEDVKEAVHLDPAAADAYQSSIDNAEHVDEVIEELEKKAEEVVEPVPEVTESMPENIYTKKYTLDESVEEFTLTSNKPKKVYDDNELDTYWDMDMHDFIYELLTTSDTRRKPIDPLGRPHAKFAVSSRDRYVGLTDEQKDIEVAYDEEHNFPDNAMLGSPQISVGDDYIDVYAVYDFRFDTIKEICNKYHFKYEGPKETYKLKRNKFMMTPRDEWIQYKYTFRIYVPCDENGIPLRIEDYFEPLGYQLEDVMNPDFCRIYRKIQKRIEKEAEEMLAKKEKERARAAASKNAEALKIRNDTTVKEIYEKHLHRAGSSNDPLNGFINDMFDELKSFTFEDGSKLKYSKTALKNEFLQEFEDDFEDEE